MGEGNYYFGIEIEVIVAPHTLRTPLENLHALYYRKLAASLRKRNLPAKADDLQGGYSKHPEHYDKWWITRDGSLGIPDGKVPMEIVSPIMWVYENWEDDIDTLWAAMTAVFHMPDRSASCGSHIHLSQGLNRPFSLPQLKTIAFGLVLYEPLILELLTRHRLANNDYCMPNTQRSRRLRSCGTNPQEVARLIQGATSKASLKDIMQDDRKVLFNFEHIIPGKSGTIEFRGGRCLWEKIRTKRWIAFTLALIHAILGMNNLENSGIRPSTAEALYNEIKRCARPLMLDDCLPENYKVLNESQN